MGGSSYSDDAASRLYSDRSAFRSSVGTAAAASATFTNNSATAVKAAGMDPATIKLREARDSVAHPRSNAIAVFFDVTGSMGHIPQNFALDANKMPGLMRLLTAHNYIEDPQILFGAIGDAYSDTSPLQVGQFESGLEMDEWLTKLFLEGGGGGQRCESYELAMLWAARHVAMDCYEKRGKKGYLFLMGDEMAYKEIPANIVKQVIGDDVQGPMKIEDVLAEAQEKFEVFFIYVQQGSYKNHPEHFKFWKGLMGERFLVLEDVNNVAELIGSTIGVCEGRGLDEIKTDLAKAGLDHTAVTDALVPYSRSASRDMARAGTTSGDLPAVAAAGTVSGSKRL